jgi:hypothetical protein
VTGARPRSRGYAQEDLSPASNRSATVPHDDRPSPPGPRPFLGTVADLATLLPRIAAKWRADRRLLPLTDAHWPIYRRLHRHSWRRLSRFPSLASPRTRNDAIQWTKLFDQRPEHVTCCDKLAVRDFIAARVGAHRLVPLLQVARRFEELDLAALPRAFVLKASHDSGSTLIVRDRATFDPAAARRRLHAALARRFGRKTGEWAYEWVPRRILVEECLEPEAQGPPGDYKFHCDAGRVLWCGYHYDRHATTKLVQVDRDGAPLAFGRLQRGFHAGAGFRKPAAWDEMIAVAETLAAGFRTLRVDLYLTGGRILVGELTVWPMAGCGTGDTWTTPGFWGALAFDDPRPLLIPHLGPRARWPDDA